MNESVGDLNKILVGTEYEKRTACIQRVLDQYNLNTLGQLDNATRTLGTRICGYSAWELISTIRERTLNPPPDPPKRMPKPNVKTATKVPLKDVMRVEESKEDKE